MTRPILKLRIASERAVVRRIEIASEPFGRAIDVRVVPPTEGPGHDREHRSAADARRYAATLARATGWPVADMIGDPDDSR